jgi:hypothetical protein
MREGLSININELAKRQLGPDGQTGPGLFHPINKLDFDYLLV